MGYTGTKSVWKLWYPPDDPDELREWIVLNNVLVQELEGMRLLKLNRRLGRAREYGREEPKTRVIS